MMEMAVFAKIGIELRILLRTEPHVLQPTKPTY